MAPPYGNSTRPLTNTSLKRYLKDIVKGEKNRLSYCICLNYVNCVCDAFKNNDWENKSLGFGVILIFFIF